MLDLGILAKLVSLTRMTMPHTTALVRVANSLGDAFETYVELKQGDGLAVLLCNLALEKVLRKLPVDTKGTLLYRSCQIVVYGDDIDIGPSNLKSQLQAKDSKALSIQNVKAKQENDQWQIRYSPGSLQINQISAFAMGWPCLRHERHSDT